LALNLLDEDGRDVLIKTSPDGKTPFKFETNFTLGRPPQLEVGESQLVNVALNFPNLPIEKLGKYWFKVSIDGSEMAQMPLKLVKGPAVPLPESQKP